ncbi:MAG: DedA family protein [Bdellovibrionota bacterium]
MIEALFAFLTSLSGTAVYLAIGGILLACGLGLPIPEDITLVTAGYLAEVGIIDRWWATAICLFAVLAGDSVIFGLGRRYGEDILDAPVIHQIFGKKRMERASYYFEKYGKKVVFIGRFIAGARAPIFLISGILKMRYRTFILLDGIAALISVPVLVWVGYTFAADIQDAFRAVRKSQHVVLIVFVAAIFAIIIYNIYGAIDRAASERAVRKFEQTHPDLAAKEHALPERTLSTSNSEPPVPPAGVSSKKDGPA